MRLYALSLSAAALFAAGCDDPTSPVDPNNPPVSNCIDADGDGYGENCDLGVDCDDNDPLRALSCEAANDAGPVITPPDHCAPGARLPDCPCAGTEEPVDCYDGAGETMGVGICHAGSRYCMGDLRGLRRLHLESL